MPGQPGCCRRPRWWRPREPRGARRARCGTGGDALLQRRRASSALKMALTLVVNTELRASHQRQRGRRQRCAQAMRSRSQTFGGGVGQRPRSGQQRRRRTKAGYSSGLCRPIHQTPSGERAAASNERAFAAPRRPEAGRQRAQQRRHDHQRGGHAQLGSQLQRQVVRVVEKGHRPAGRASASGEVEFARSQCRQGCWRIIASVLFRSRSQSSNVRLGRARGAAEGVVRHARPFGHAPARWRRRPAAWRAAARRRAREPAVNSATASRTLTGRCAGHWHDAEHAGRGQRHRHAPAQPASSTSVTVAMVDHINGLLRWLGWRMLPTARPG